MAGRQGTRGVLSAPTTVGGVWVIRPSPAPPHLAVESARHQVILVVQ